MLKNRLIYLLLLLLAAGIYVFTNTYETLLLLLFTIVLPVLSLVLMFLSGRNLHLSLEVPASAEKGNAVIGCKIRNEGRFPVAGISIPLRLENQMTGESIIRKMQSSIGGRRSARYELKIKNCHAGEMAVSAENIRVRDTFGLFTWKLAKQNTKRMLVYPDQANLHVLMQQTTETRGEGQRYSEHRPGQDVTELFSIRDYVPGDEIRSIHWKLSSKTGKILTREFSQPVHYSLTVLIELDGRDADVLDRILSVGITLSETLIDEGIKHDLVWFDAADDQLCVKTMDSFGSLEEACGQILGTASGENAGTTLAQFLEHHREQDYGELLCVTSAGEADRLTLQEDERIVVLPVSNEDKPDEEREIII